MPEPLSQAYLESGLASWARLSRVLRQSAFLSALRSPAPLPSPPAPTDPFSLRIARRVADAVERLAGRAEEKPRAAIGALAADVRRMLSPIAAGEWNAEIRRRRPMAETVMEGLHVLTIPGVQLRVDSAVRRLRERLSEEMSAPFTASQANALQVTNMLLSDFEELYAQVLATFSCARAMGSPHICVALLPVIHELYCKLGDWILAVESEANAKPGAFVKSFGKDDLRIMMLRENTSLPWGLQLNEHGRLSSLSAAVRVESPLGSELHNTISSYRGGVSISTINLAPVSLDGMDPVEAIETLDDLTRKHRRIYVTLKPNPATQEKALEELAFYATEPTRDVPIQRANLILRRHVKHHPWSLAMTTDLLLKSVSPNILSKEAAAFVSAHSGRLRVAAVNGVEVATPEQVKSLSATVHTLVVELRVLKDTSEFVENQKEGNAGERQKEKKGKEKEKAGKKEKGGACNQSESVNALAKEPESGARLKDSNESPTNTPITSQKQLNEEKPHTSKKLTAKAVKEQKEKSKTNIESGTAAPEPSDTAIDANTEKPLAPNTTDPLLFPNNVTMELLTAEEMILQRSSADRKWGVALRTTGEEPQRKISILSLPDLTDTQRRRHPYYKLFNANAGKWNIHSVNGTAASQLPDILDILKYALRIKIKFFRF